MAAVTTRARRAHTQRHYGKRVAGVEEEGVIRNGKEMRQDIEGVTRIKMYANKKLEILKNF